MLGIYCRGKAHATIKLEVQWERFKNWWIRKWSRWVISVILRIKIEKYDRPVSFGLDGHGISLWTWL